jgi:UDP-3-O-[3-hydroxymyristoyl] glucosamine N-acyltransferase
VFSLAELSGHLDLTFTGDGSKLISGLASLENAGPEDLTFLSTKKQVSQLECCAAAAVILQPEYSSLSPIDCIISDDPYLSFARISQLFSEQTAAEPGVHPTAVIGEGADIDESAHVGPGAIIGSGCFIGRDVSIGARVFVGDNACVGERTRIFPGAVLYHGVQIGADCRVHSNAVIGADGFGYAKGPAGWEKIAQLGSVRIADRVEIGACTTVDRGTLDDTVIEEGVIIDNQVQIGHNCRIGRNTAIAGCVGLAGSTMVGENCTLAGGVGAVGHITICDNVHVTGMSMVTRSITEPGSWSSGTPMMDTNDWKRSAVRFGQLESLNKRLAVLEQAIEDSGLEG